MIQRVVRQLGDADLLKSALVVSHHTQTEITRNHIGDRIPIISERHRRGTFPAVALATTYFYSKLHADEKDIVCFLPADQFVESSFFDMIKRLPDILDRSGAELSLIGTAPTHPSSQFGYIVPASESKTDYHRIERFVEKRMNSWRSNDCAEGNVELRSVCVPTWLLTYDSEEGKPAGTF